METIERVRDQLLELLKVLVRTTRRNPHRRIRSTPGTIPSLLDSGREDKTSLH